MFSRIIFIVIINIHFLGCSGFVGLASHERHERHGQLFDAWVVEGRRCRDVANGAFGVIFFCICEGMGESVECRAHDISMENYEALYTIHIDTLTPSLTLSYSLNMSRMRTCTPSHRIKNQHQ